MKSKRISVLILSIALFLSITLILVGSGLSKPKPNPNPEQNSEWITFSGDLYGEQEVVGCCPNAGPNPNYTMTLSGKFSEEFLGEHTGYIFMNSFGRNMEWDYKVVFWWTEDGTVYSIEIRGGEAHKDKRTKILTVTFDEVRCYEIWIGGLNYTEIVRVSFILTRDPHHPANK